MSEERMMRLGQVARQLNVGISTIVDHLVTKGFKDIEANPNTKITGDQFNLLLKEFQSDKNQKKEASNVNIGKKYNENITLKAENTPLPKKVDEDNEFLIKNVSANDHNKETNEVEKFETSKVILTGPKVLGKIDLNNPIKITNPIVETPTIKVKEEIVVEKKEIVEKKEEETPIVVKIEKVPETVVETIVVEERVEIPVEKERPQELEKIIEVETPVEPNISNQVVANEQINDTVVSQPVIFNTETPEVSEEVPSELIEAKADQLKGLTVLGKIVIPTDNRPVKKKEDIINRNKEAEDKKKKRKRLPPPVNKPTNVVDSNNREKPKENTNGTGNNRFQKPAGNGGNNTGQQNRFGNNNTNSNNNTGNNANKRFEKPAVTDKEIQDKIKDTLAKLGAGKKDQFSNRAKYRKDKRNAAAEANEEKMLQEQEDSKTLKVTEFVSTSDLASLMDVSVNEVISVCLSLGMFVSINQRLDAEAITVIADEFGFAVQFVSAKEEDDIEIEEDDESDLEFRAPIVTIMGHVDHGKTSLLDYIRRTKVTASEAGGITQHIGAYDVLTDTQKPITFLDTPGHEAFTAMRARGAKVTDIVIIVVAADDTVMPQTKEAINHAQVAGVPIVIAINKIDKPAANPDRIKEALSKENILVEEWGGKYQCQEISAKTGQGIPELLEKVLLEAELLELTANPDKRALGTVIEASLDKGRGYVTTLLVQAGTMKVGDIVLAGIHFGRVKAMLDHTGAKLKIAGPSKPVQILGFSGAPQAGDKFNVMETEREAREIATRREQLIREQSVRTKKHITLDEIGRRLAIGNFKELNIIVKGDVDGSVEALSDSLLKQSTNEIHVNILHKGVGQISESDVLLASASDAIIVGFQVRPSPSAKKLAEQEQIEIRLYSIIYDAINEIRDAMEGMLAPTFEEIIVGNIDVRDVFKISKVGTVAGCMVTDGLVKRNSTVRLIRDGIVLYTGDLLALKRFKDDVSEVKFGYECGLSLKGFNDILVGDTLEVFEQKEIKRKL